MKLNSDAVWTTTPNHLRLLSTIEQLSKNHQNVPIPLIKSISNIKCNHSKLLLDLCKLKFIRYEKVGYKMQYNGYDCLAINTLRKRGLEVMGDKVGVGKESDIYYGRYKGEEVVLKFHRLGRTSFRTVKNNRDYHEGRQFCSWLYLSAISAQKEAEYMKIFEKLPIPQLKDNNRHVVVMQFLVGFSLLNDIDEIDNKDKAYNELMDFLISLWNLGYAHGDFNEFNVMINEKSEIKVIDFPQCVSNSNNKAKEYLKRDYECINSFFLRKFKFLAKCDEVDALINKE